LERTLSGAPTETPITKAQAEKKKPRMVISSGIKI